MNPTQSGNTRALLLPLMWHMCMLCCSWIRVGNLTDTALIFGVRSYVNICLGFLKLTLATDSIQSVVIISSFILQPISTILDTNTLSYILLKDFTNISSVIIRLVTIIGSQSNISDLF